MTLPRLYLLLIPPLIAALAWWLSDKIIIQREEIRHPPKQEIRNNPLAALEQLLKSRGFHVETFFDKQSFIQEFRNQPLGSEHTLLLRNLSQPLSAEKIAELLSWVESGGELIYEIHPNHISSDEHALHKRLGVNAHWIQGQLFQEPSLQELEPEKLESEEQESEIEYTQDISLDSLHGRFQLDGEQGFIRLYEEHILTSNNPAAQALIISDAGIHALRLIHGKGRVTLLTETRFMTTPITWGDAEALQQNKKSGLNSHDHAYFSYWLLQANNNIWLLQDRGSISLLALIYKNFPSFSLFAIFWLILFFVYLLRRLGPQKSQAESQPQNLKDHIYQVGLFHWQQDKANFLLNRWRTRLLRRLQQRQPQLAGLELLELVQQLAQQVDFSQQALLDALQKKPHTHSDLLTQIQILKTLWKI